MKIVSLKRYTKTNTNTLPNTALLLCFWITTGHSTGNHYTASQTSQKKAGKKQNKQKPDLAPFVGTLLTMPKAKKLFFLERQKRKQENKVSPQTVPPDRKETKQMPQKTTRKLKDRPHSHPPKKFVSMLDRYIASREKRL